MSIGDSTVLSVALLMRVVTIIMCMLGTEAPVAYLPEGTLLYNMIGMQLVALEAIGELGFASLMPLA